MEIQNQEKIDWLIANGEVIKAIKEVMDATGMSLRESKEYVEDRKVGLVTENGVTKTIVHTVPEEEGIRCPECGSSQTQECKGFFGIKKIQCLNCKKKF